MKLVGTQNLIRRNCEIGRHAKSDTRSFVSELSGRLEAPQESCASAGGLQLLVAAPEIRTVGGSFGRSSRRITSFALASSEWNCKDLMLHERYYLFVVINQNVVRSKCTANLIHLKLQIQIVMKKESSS